MSPLNRSSLASLALPALLLSAPAAAQSILVTHFSFNGGRHLAAFDPQNGALQSACFLDYDISGNVNRPVQAALVNGEWWVTDNVTETAHVYSRYGGAYLRDEFGLNGDTAGCVTAFGSSWFLAQEAPFASGTLIEVHAGGAASFHPISADSPEGIGVFQGELVITDGRRVKRFDPVTRTEIGDLYSSNGQQGMLQPIVRPSTGNLLIARQASHQDVVEIDSSGSIVAEFDVFSVLGLGGPFACMELGDGNFLLSTDAGVFVIDPALTSSTPVLTGVRARFMTLGPTAPIGTSYCGPAVPNASGRSAWIAATGSDVASIAEFRLTAHDMPLLSSGYFIASQPQGLTANPGGSIGTLCLGGSIGRLAMQIRSTSAVGYFDIEVDTTAVPQANGTLPILMGQTWNWQAWFRDNVAGQTTSNFTDAVSVTFG